MDLITAKEARRLAENKIRDNREKAFSMIEHLIRISAEDGKFSVRITSDNILTDDILRTLSAVYKDFGYKCEIDDSASLTISW